MKDDLLHEAYIQMLKVKPEVIERFNSVGKLYNIGLLVIRSLYQKRYYKKRNKSEGGSSPLHEVNNEASKQVKFNILDIMSYPLNGDDEFLKPDLLEIITDYRSEEDPCVKVKYVVSDALNIEDDSIRLSVGVFVKATEDSILGIHKKTGISRGYLSKRYKEGREYLLAEMNR